MNALKITIKTPCNTCGCIMKHVRSIKVNANNKALAISQAEKKIDQYKKMFANENCKVCKSIINDVKRGE